MSLDPLIANLFAVALTSLVSSVVTAKVYAAVLQERVKNLGERLDRMERLLERLVPPLKGGSK